MCEVLSSSVSGDIGKRNGLQPLYMYIYVQCSPVLGMQVVSTCRLVEEFYHKMG